MLLAILTGIDDVTGHEFGFFMFDFIPVSIAACFPSRRSGLAFAFASGPAWYASELLFRRHLLWREVHRNGVLAWRG